MIQDVNPFVYSHPLAPEDIVDREDEVRDLLRNAVGGHYVRLYAPRKYGKTSLLRCALRDGERDEGLIPILVDLYRVSSIADVTVRLERAYAKQLKGELRGKIESFLQRTGVGLSLGAFGISARLQLEPTSDPLPALHALLELPLRLEASGGYRAFIAFDEFQDIGRIDGLDGLLRSHVQHQGEVASYVFAGSEPGLMRLLFETKDRPLYGSAVPMRLGRLADTDIAEYVERRFEETGRRTGEALSPLLHAARGHPQRAMLLAHRLWEAVSQGEGATLDAWDVAYRAAAQELDPEFDAQWRGLDTSEQKTLRALLLGDGAPYRSAALRRLELTKDVVRRALPRLAATAEIEEREGGGYAIVDPLFAGWVARLNDRPFDAGQPGGAGASGTEPGL
jgi:AAA+ ATPase superfamily predicted ATPase